MALAVFAVLTGSLNLIWLGLVGWFITVLADSAYKQQVIKESLHRNTVLTVASRDVVVAPADITVEELIFDFFVEGPHTRYPVVDGGAIIGMATLDAAKKVPRAEWAMTRVRDITDTDLASLVIEADAPADKLLDRMRKDAHSALIVKQDGNLAGIVTRADMTSYLRRAKIDI
ncbi:MAG: CBS domain-containing protein [Actinobacteria bacterium]|nr:CBS domain-containing protein [Actinomycetota bacterium]